MLPQDVSEVAITAGSTAVNRAIWPAVAGGLGGVLLLVLGGLLYSGDPLPPQPQDVVPTPSHTGALAFLLAMMPVLFSFGGWQNGTYIAAELRRPQRDLPFSIIGGTLVVIVSYRGSDEGAR